MPTPSPGTPPPDAPPQSAAAPAPTAPAAVLFENHRSRLQQLLRIEATEEEARPRRCGRLPTARQCLQQDIRKEVVDCCQTLRDQGVTLQECGQLLHISPRTLRWWDHDVRSEPLCLTPVGRPVARSPLPVRRAVLDYLQVTGPGVGVPTLQERFRDVARAELADLLKHYREAWRRRHAESPRVLHWQTPGRVWAADFTEPSRLGETSALPPIAGRYPYVLAVRDLASGYMLAWEPLPSLSEEVTEDALGRLFALHGAPLILKTDNGSAFRAGAFARFLEAAGVIPLYSPPSWPGYNGAIEAAIGSLKSRTEGHAQAQGRAGVWESSDLSHAQNAANAGHPRRLNGRTPTSVWEARTPIAMLERVVFALTVERQRFQVKEELGIGQEECLDHWRGSAVNRRAIERALVEHGYLLFTRRRTPLTIRGAKAAADV